MSQANKSEFLQPEREVTRRQFLALPLPIGKLELDSSRCTGCRLCASSCPTEALFFSSEEDRYHLLFSQKLCIGCAQCLESCPENCLHLTKVLEPECLDKPPVVLFEDSLIRCRECGAPIAPQAMLTVLKGKLSDRKVSHLTLCPDCRLRALMRR